MERETQDKPAGTRTFAVVGIGACLFTVASERAFSGGDDAVSRVVAQIVTGVGFLGAGTIIQVKDRVEGLTTAAGIWSAAAVGMTFGFGLYVLGIGSTLVLLVAIALIGRLLPVKYGGMPDEPPDKGSATRAIGTRRRPIRSPTTWRRAASPRRPAKSKTRS